MDRKNTLEYIKSLDKFGIALGLTRIEMLLEELSHPELCMDFVHVGGTNGKGSVSVMVESILREGGFKTGLFTSPHLQRYTERMKVCGQEIPLEAVERITGRLKSIARDMGEDESIGHPTEFEICTAIGFEWFREQKVEIAVVEVGLGGLLDSTNVIVPQVSVITNVGLDHQEVLGNDIKEIAAQKAGIIKAGVPVVISSQLPEVHEVLKKAADEKNSFIYQVGKDVHFKIEEMGLIKTKVTLKIDEKSELRRSLEKYDVFNGEIHMAGAYQASNAACAMAAVSVLRMQEKYKKISDENILKGFSKAKHPGRFEVVSQSPLVILDGAHNLDGACALSSSLSKLFPGGKVVMLMSLSKDKPAYEMLQVLKDKISYLVVTKSEHTRMGSFAPDELLNIAKMQGISAEKIDDLDIALDVAKSKANDDPIIICGSLYLIGEIKSILSR